MHAIRLDAPREGARTEELVFRIQQAQCCDVCFLAKCPRIKKSKMFMKQQTTCLMASSASFLVTFCKLLSLESSPCIGWHALQSSNTVSLESEGRLGSCGGRCVPAHCECPSFHPCTRIVWHSSFYMRLCTCAFSLRKSMSGGDNAASQCEGCYLPPPSVSFPRHFALTIAVPKPWSLAPFFFFWWFLCPSFFTFFILNFTNPAHHCVEKWPAGARSR
jgi:hypothetical protein